jgi:hypothetical protein
MEFLSVIADPVGTSQRVLGRDPREHKAVSVWAAITHVAILIAQANEGYLGLAVVDVRQTLCRSSYPGGRGYQACFHRSA